MKLPILSDRQVFYITVATAFIQGVVGRAGAGVGPVIPIPARRCYQCNGPLGPMAVSVHQARSAPRDLCGPKCVRAYEAGDPLDCGVPPLTSADLPSEADPREERAVLNDWLGQ